MRLIFRRLTADYWVANPDGSATERLGEEIYVVRTTPALVRDSPQAPWRSQSPDGYIMAEGLTLSAAKADCEQAADGDHELDDFDPCAEGGGALCEGCAQPQEPWRYSRFCQACLWDGRGN
jgi:hypothetical protein